MGESLLVLEQRALETLSECGVGVGVEVGRIPAASADRQTLAQSLSLETLSPVSLSRSSLSLSSLPPSLPLSLFPVERTCTCTCTLDRQTLNDAHGHACVFVFCLRRARAGREGEGGGGGAVKPDEERTRFIFFEVVLHRAATGACLASRSVLPPRPM